MTDMNLSENSGTPKSSILIGFSIINHPFWGYPYSWKDPYSCHSSTYNLKNPTNQHPVYQIPFILGEWITHLAVKNPPQMLPVPRRTDGTSPSLWKRHFSWKTKVPKQCQLRFPEIAYDIWIHIPYKKQKWAAIYKSLPKKTNFELLEEEHDVILEEGGNFQPVHRCYHFDFCVHGTWRKKAAIWSFK